MKSVARLAFAAFTVFAASGNARAQDNVAHTVLSSEDVALYGTIFRAEKAGQTAKSDAAIAKLEDKTLLGYVMMERFLGPGHKSKYAELKSWLDKYGDLAGADRVYALAQKRAPKKAHVPEPPPVHWRGAPGEGEAFADIAPASAAARQMLDHMRGLTRSGKSEQAGELLKTVAVGPAFPEADLNRLGAYVAAVYLAEAKDNSALGLAEDVAAREAEAAAQCHWIAGLAAYRMGMFAVAAKHFKSVTQMSGSAARTSAAGAFWAARSWMRAGSPERVLPLYELAASQPDSFYGFIAARMIGGKEGTPFVEPVLDNISFANLMANGAAHRAVALWQIGHTADMGAELARALGQIAPNLDSAFAALARHLDVPQLELRAAELASAPDHRLSSLYPVPSFQPKGGYMLDEAILFAFAKQESRFQPDAVSRSGARGLMQLMPKTAALVAHDASLAGANKERLDDPTFSMTLGQQYLRTLIDRQNGNLFAMAAAYNAGEGNLAKWKSTVDDPLLFVESIPVTETREYVKRVIMNLWMYRKRLGEPMDGVEETAAGAWPVYRKSGTTLAN